MAFKTMMGPDLNVTKETFDTPPRDNPPADFAPLVLTGYDATIDGVHSYMRTATGMSTGWNALRYLATRLSVP